MKNRKVSNILMTLLAVVMLIVFASAVTWPSLTDEAYEAHMEMMWN